MHNPKTFSLKGKKPLNSEVKSEYLTLKFSENELEKEMIEDIIQQESAGQWFPPLFSFNYV